MIPVLTIDTRCAHKMCKQRGCVRAALADNNLCEIHRDKQRGRVRIAMRKARGPKPVAPVDPQFPLDCCSH